MKSEEIEINGVKYIREPKVCGRVLVRCRNAGVHVGTLASRDSDTLVLERANRIWRWRGAHDLNAMAVHGVNRNEHTKISVMVPRITLTCSDVCEVIPVAEGVDLTQCGDVT